MIFADLASGDSVFVDANVLVYYFTPHPTFGTACEQLMQRIDSRPRSSFSCGQV